MTFNVYTNIFICTHRYVHIHTICVLMRKLYIRYLTSCDLTIEFRSPIGNFCILFDGFHPSVTIYKSLSRKVHWLTFALNKEYLCLSFFVPFVPFLVSSMSSEGSLSSSAISSFQLRSHTHGCGLEKCRTLCGILLIIYETISKTGTNFIQLDLEPHNARCMMVTVNYDVADHKQFRTFGLRM